MERDLPHEIDYLRRHDEARRKIMDTVEMPDRLADDLLFFIRQNDGTLSKKRREREFDALTDEEVARIEEVVRVAFDGYVGDAASRAFHWEGVWFPPLAASR